MVQDTSPQQVSAQPALERSFPQAWGWGHLQAGMDEDRGSLVSSEKVSLISFEQKWKGPHSFIQHMFMPAWQAACHLAQSV